MAKVSIIIPVYNVAPYVPTTITSAIEQTEADIEIILVDDGSTDGSAAICDDFASKDLRIHVIHKENGGLASARNCGTQAATSDYVMFLDGDDYLRLDAVERLISVATQYPSDFIQFRYREVPSGTAPMPDITSNGNIYQAHTPKELFENLYKLGGVAASGATKFMTRKLAFEIPFVNIRHEDEMWCTEAFQRNLTVTYIPDELYYYVMRDNSIIHSTFNRKKLEKFDVHRQRLVALEACKLPYLLSKEYGKLFLSIVCLYCEACECKDITALQRIKETFHTYKNHIKQCSDLPYKFKLLAAAMAKQYSTIYLYFLYRKFLSKNLQ